MDFQQFVSAVSTSPPLVKSFWQLAISQIHQRRERLEKKFFLPGGNDNYMHISIELSKLILHNRRVVVYGAIFYACMLNKC